MATRICNMPTDELAATLVETERLAGPKTDGAMALQAEVARRAATDEAVAGRVDRARRLAVMIEEGMTMAEFKAAGLSLADRRLAFSLGAKKNWPRMAGGAFSVFNQRDDLDSE